MEAKPNPNSFSAKTILPRILRLIWQCIPFIGVLVVSALILLPLMLKISDKKADLAQAQAMQTKENRALTNVVTMEISPQEVVEKISLPGVAKPWISLNLVTEVRGKIVTKQVEEGMTVKKGDVLAIIDTRDYQHNYDSALASYETALTNQKRSKALSEKQFITQSQLDDVQTRVKTTKAAVNLARLNLDRCTIRSPMAGVVDRVFIEYGNFLDAGDPVAAILEMDRLKIEVGIPESDVSAVRKLSQFDMQFDALDKKTVTGDYHYLYKTTDSMARLYNLEIRVDNPDLEILPDMFARVSIVKNHEPQGLAVPIYSLVTQNNETGVFVENKGEVAFRPVTTGFQDGWKILVSKGLEPGERVVVVGHKIIENGESVKVARTVHTMEELIQ
ncbi:MAG: efflux RND transporter periplasmic adaptor subunit [Desulfobacter sp.]|nr:efflux RND transporter periplasmic adaptor subunit [Desulfobacter sp.]WDP84415.1 MAG: efflux RND transporter periplasmic adaptor subunit [Desulfobacter sp.]